MKRRFFFLIILALSLFNGSAQVLSSRVFFYNPDERAGLRMAKQNDHGSWQDIGQLCSSDYGKWGAEKRMYHPSLARSKDGSWRLVFQVNSTSPLFAAAYSKDLVTWRPQDYPLMTTPQCLKPVVSANEDGTFTIYTPVRDKKVV